jgi:hypothetical protein
MQRNTAAVQYSAMAIAAQSVRPFATTTAIPFFLGGYE